MVLALFALAGPVRAEHNDAHPTEKYVTAVNGVPVTDPNRGAGAGFIEVETGDLVTFTIVIADQGAGSTVEISDVYKKNQFEFVSSSGATCQAPGVVDDQDNKVDCTVTTNASGDASLTLTFRVIAEGSSGEGCPTITNTAHVGGLEDRLSDVAQVKVCNEPGFPLNLVKRNQSGAALGSVSFTLTASGQATGTTLVTNAQGMLTFPDLDPGNYTLTETAPPGCTGIGSITLSIAANGNVTLSAANAAVAISGTPLNTLTITNNCPPPTGTLSLLKVDDSAAAATRGGAVFTLTRANFSATATTVAAGTASFTALLAGDYLLAETTAPTGCTGFAGSITIRVAADGSVSTVGTLPTGVTFTSGTATLRVVNTCPVQQAVLGGNPTPTPTPVVRQGTLAGSLPNTATDGPMTQLPVIFLALLTLGSLGYLGRANLAAVNKRR
jgi:hypothetical protein